MMMNPGISYNHFEGAVSKMLEEQAVMMNPGCRHFEGAVSEMLED